MAARLPRSAELCEGLPEPAALHYDEIACVADESAWPSMSVNRWHVPRQNP